MLNGNSTAEKIWNYLMSKINNPYGVAGLMGNMKAESSLKSNNLQGSFEKKLGYTDETYTAAVDSGKYTNFVHDKAGYGLVQWTYWSLKQYLYDFAKKKGTSIGDLEMQLECVCTQLKENYPSIWSALINAKSVLEASNVVLLKFERPADQSSAVQAKRASYGQSYYDEFNSAVKEEKPTMKTITVKPSSPVRIGHSSIDENGHATGGKAGDQTKKEVVIRNWYAKSWTVLLRPKKYSVAMKMVAACEAGCKNDNIGYDQYQRNTLRAEAKKVNFNLAKITTPCECDCSSFMSVCAEAAGVDMTKAYNGSSNAPVTSNMRSRFKATGAFDVLTDSKYLNSSDYLQAGDILVAEGHHTVMVLDYGKKVTSIQVDDDEVVTPTTPATPTTPTEDKKTVAEIAKEVLDGKWGNGDDRKSRLTAAGYNYKEVQAAVNALLKGETIPAKPTSKAVYDSNMLGDYTVTASSLHLRSGAGTNKKSIVLIPFNTKAYCNGYYEVDSSNNRKWPYIKVTVKGKTYEGFSSSLYLKKV